MGNIIKKKNLLIKFGEIFDSQKMTKKTKSSFLGSILTSFFELLEKVYDRKCLGLSPKGKRVVKLTISDLMEIPHLNILNCPKICLKMLNNANERYSYYLKVFVFIFESK